MMLVCPQTTSEDVDRLVQGVAVFLAGAVVLGTAVVWAMVHLAGWREPESEEDFEELVQRAEQLAAEGRWGEEDGGLDDDVSAEDPQPVKEDEDFRALVRAATSSTAPVTRAASSTTPPTRSPTPTSGASTATTTSRTMPIPATRATPTRAETSSGVSTGRPDAKSG